RHKRSCFLHFLDVFLSLFCCYLFILIFVAVLQAEPHCSGGYRADFVLDTEDALKSGAVLLDTPQAQSPEECETACCGETLCNLALMEPNGACTLFNCVYRNVFVCDKYSCSICDTKLITPPIAVAGRDLVVQPGDTVELNGIESHTAGGKILKYSWTLLHGNSSVSMEKTEHPDQVRVSGLDSGSYHFQLTVTDSNGNSATDKILVLVLTAEQSSLFCLASLKVGPCRASFTRWRYDAVQGVCRNFTYGGCKGNYNNFLSAAACETACRGVSESRVHACGGSSGVCGTQCAPGQLICDSDCCVHKSLECDGVTQCKDGADELTCEKREGIKHSQPPQTGPCRANFVHWFFDPLQQKCQSFTYGGCDANDNNHETEAQCEASCSGVTGEENGLNQGLMSVHITVATSTILYQWEHGALARPQHQCW
uniref:Uncharacterized protein n=1 Tax=Neogobius melanostomus TaxID=47308 RepID=A0A8C6SLM1_9GOBI